MAEEHRCQTSENHRPCSNNCGFFGSPATMNLCSKCYKDFCLRERQQKSIISTVESSLSPPPPSSSSSPSPDFTSVTTPPPSSVDISARDVLAVNQSPGRCSVCRKRVGLTGFKCRCGITFCGAHRYPEKHGCSFDFKKMGKDQIARANPVVKADKLDKI